MADHIHIPTEVTGGFLSRIFETFTPRRQCMNYEADVIWLHLVSDVLIALAYFSIPMALVYFTRRRKDLAFNWIFLLFALFIVLCGTTHLFNVLALWMPLYRLDGVVKLLTGIASIGTAVALFRLIPAALALASPEQLRSINENLANEVAERKRVEEDLRLARDGLERRVFERTDALRDSEERFRTLAESVSQLVWMARQNGDVFWFNKRWYDYTGQTSEQVLGSPWQAVHHPDQLSKVVEIWQHSIARGDPFEMEFPLRAADGTFHPFLTRVMPSRDAEGRIVYWCGTSTDITQRVEFEQSLKEASRRKDEFLAMLAHELRNPLSSIVNATLVVERTESEADREWATSIIRRNIKKLSRFVEDLIDVSRITQGKVALQKQRIDASSAIASAVEAVQPLIDEKKLHLSPHYEQGTLWCEADPLRLEQILLNLLSNAAHYTENQGQISLFAVNDGDELVITVQDSGIGIAPQLLHQMFDLFAQGERTLARTQGGLGIGLTLVKKLVEMHGGTVTAESAGPGKGSEFTVRLPAYKEPYARPGETAATHEPNGASRRILVVDDNIDTANALSQFLKLLGHETRTAYDGPTALVAAREYHPDVLLLDIGLPGMTGYDVARALRQEALFRNSLIVAISGYGKDEDRERSREAGIDHHLVKPIDHTTLSDILARGAEMKAK